MEATFIKIINPADASFVMKMDDIPFKNPWHYHPEYEILYFIDAKGTRFIGDSIENINNGEIILMGPNLPHTTQRDKLYYDINKYCKPKMLVVQFDKNFLGQEVWNKTEFLPVSELLERAGRGMKFTGRTADAAASMLVKMAEQKGVRKVTQLLCLLEEFAFSDEFSYISSPGFLKLYDETDDKINQVYEYTINNFREDISLEKIANHVYLSQSAFCRYFKNKTRKTYSQFLAEVRIGYACKLLLQEKLNISEICYECGYKNLSNFNRHFKDIMHITPSEYLNNFDNVSREKSVA
jgi:AraC-like DNA-binding protein